MSLWRWLLPLLVVVAVGCGPRITPVKTPPPIDTLKTTLERIISAGSGQKTSVAGEEPRSLGSEAGALFPAIERVKKTHPEQGQALEEDAKKLMPIIMSPRGPRSPEAQKLAKEMLKKLESLK